MDTQEGRTGVTQAHPTPLLNIRRIHFAWRKPGFERVNMADGNKQILFNPNRFKQNNGARAASTQAGMGSVVAESSKDPFANIGQARKGVVVALPTPQRNAAASSSRGGRGKGIWEPPSRGSPKSSNSSRGGQQQQSRPIHSSGMQNQPNRMSGSGQIDPTDFDRRKADKEILNLYLSAPTVYSGVYSPHSRPFHTAYIERLTKPDPRSDIYPPVLENMSTLTSECYRSWQASAPSEETLSAISRIVWNVNEAIADKWPRLRFVVEPFGSISWRGETGGAGDLDLVLRDYSKPLGYTENLWGPGGGSNRSLPSVYNMFVVGRWLEAYGYQQVNPIKHASCPIGKRRLYRDTVALY